MANIKKEPAYFSFLIYHQQGDEWSGKNSLKKKKRKIRVFYYRKYFQQCKGIKEAYFSVTKYWYLTSFLTTFFPHHLPLCRCPHRFSIGFKSGLTDVQYKTLILFMLNLIFCRFRRIGSLAQIHSLVLSANPVLE